MSPAHPPYIGRRPPRSFGRVVALAVTGISVLAACGTSPEADAADLIDLLTGRLVGLLFGADDRSPEQVEETVTRLLRRIR